MSRFTLTYEGFANGDRRPTPRILRDESLRVCFLNSITMCHHERSEGSASVFCLLPSVFCLSVASTAENFRSTCGSERGAPECSTQRSPAATPHVGQGTEDNCLGVSSFFFIATECDNPQPENCSI